MCTKLEIEVKQNNTKKLTFCDSQRDLGKCVLNICGKRSKKSNTLCHFARFSCTSRVHNIKEEIMTASLCLINSSQELYQQMNGLSGRKEMGNVLLCAAVSSLRLMYCQNHQVSNKMLLIIEDKQLDLDLMVVSFSHRHNVLIRLYFNKL